MSFSDLGKNQAVIFGDVLVVKLEGRIEIDGVEVNNNTYGSRIATHKDADIFRVVNLGQEIIHYENQDGDKMSKEEYDEKNKDSRGEWDDDEERYTYDSLEGEFACRKIREELSQFSPKYKDLGEKREKVEYTVVGTLEDTGSPYIRTPIKYGSSKWKYNRGFYKCNLTAAARSKYIELAEKYKDKAAFQVEATRNYIRFSRINNNYAFSDRTPFTENSEVYVDTLSEAKEKIKWAESEVERIVLGIVSPVGLDGEIASKLLGEISRLKESCRGLSVRQRSRTSSGYVIRKLAAMEDDLKKVIDSKNKAL